MRDRVCVGSDHSAFSCSRCVASSPRCFTSTQSPTFTSICPYKPRYRFAKQQLIKIVMRRFRINKLSFQGVLSRLVSHNQRYDTVTAALHCTLSVTQNVAHSHTKLLMCTKSTTNASNEVTDLVAVAKGCAGPGKQYTLMQTHPDIKPKCSNSNSKRLVKCLTLCLSLSAHRSALNIPC